MRSFRRVPKLRLAFLALGAAYPFLVYFGLSYVRPAALVLVLLGMVALKLLFDRPVGRERLPKVRALWLLGAAFLVAVMAALSPVAALKSYPVLVSLGFAAVFGLSLLRPPSMVERIARLGEPDLPDAAIPYLRTVTLIWLGFFLLNSAASIATALFGSLALWTFYNGLLSYLIMGALFLGELIVRNYLRPGRTRA